LSLHKGACVQFVELKLVMWCALLRFGWTVLKTFGLKCQSVVESLLAHIGFFLRSFGMVFHSVAELYTRSLIGSYGIISLRWSVGKACILHSVWIAELKLNLTIDIGVWKALPEGTANSIWIWYDH